MLSHFLTHLIPQRVLLHFIGKTMTILKLQVYKILTIWLKQASAIRVLDCLSRNFEGLLLLRSSMNTQDSCLSVAEWINRTLVGQTMVKEYCVPVHILQSHFLYSVCWTLHLLSLSLHNRTFRLWTLTQRHRHRHRHTHRSGQGRARDRAEQSDRTGTSHGLLLHYCTSIFNKLCQKQD